jgi:putative hydrolase of the HAD superfamily
MSILTSSAPLNNPVSPSNTTALAITTLGLDADDTLWHNEDGFHRVEQHFVEMVTPHLPNGSTLDVLHTLAQRERDNVKVFGYGVKSFTFSMIETAISATNGTIPAETLTLIIEEGRILLTRPTELLDGVQETLAKLAAMYRLVLVTKGDHHHQQSKLTESGLDRWFSATEIVHEKDTHTYQRIISEHTNHPEAFAMVGNSLKSDVIPVLDVGSSAIHIPYAFTWALEQASISASHQRSGRFFELTRLTELPALLASWNV